ncbi:MAG: 50S ribosomal protein L16 [Nanoarchaeota archaeon]|nr:50S ribosomal protein L16 [Nanoarchaeota archaeon]
MAGLRKASAYTKQRAVPYTRTSKKKARSYIKTVPPRKLVKLRMGDLKAERDGKFKKVINLISTENAIIRDNALESVRQTVHKHMEKNHPGNFFFEVKVYPHHILRENKMITGAGADRMQSGMKHSFGKTMNTGAFVKPNQVIFVVSVNSQKGVHEARIAFGKSKPKIPCRVKIVVESRSSSD